MFKILANLVLALIVLVPNLVNAQVPTKQARLFLDSNQQTDACGASQEIWQIMDGTCIAPGTTPWVQTLRVRLGSSIINVPRANITRLTLAAECTPNPAPCLRTSAISLPAAGNVTVSFVTGAGDEGGPSAAVPFSPVAALPSAPGTLRLEILP